MIIRTSVEAKRGCGYRRSKGIYLVCDGPGQECELLPAELSVCPTCHQGIKPSRSWTWVVPDPLLPHHDEVDAQPHRRDFRQTFPVTAHPGCPLNKRGLLGERCGLLWIGEAFYKTPADFTAEAARMGISRRIPAVPRDFVAGETWVLLAHRKALPAGYIDTVTESLYATLEDAVEADVDARTLEPRFLPGVFSVFRPSRVEYAVEGDETEAELEALVARGLEPVRVVRDIDAQERIDA